jgi:hypothetical protein
LEHFGTAGNSLKVAGGDFHLGDNRGLESISTPLREHPTLTLALSLQGEGRGKL